MTIDGVTNAGAVPTLERLVQFAGARHRVIVNNVANLSTPGFRAADVSVSDFQRRLGEAVDRHRKEGGGLELKPTREVTVASDRILLRPSSTGQAVPQGDGNDRNVERTMQDLVENYSTFRVAAELLRSRFDLINTAIRERI